jgi:predicted transcriptional regulator
MVRPAAKELTERELEVMHVFWGGGQMTAVEARDELAALGTDLAYVTVANLVRLLVEKGYLEPMNRERPFRYRPVRAFQEVSRSLVGDLLQRVFRGSREQLLVQVLGQKKLTPKERSAIEQFLKEQDQ